MEDVATWLKTLGLERYAACFAENDINFAILSELTDQDLKEIGVSSLGHRRQLLRAIAEHTDAAKPASHAVLLSTIPPREQVASAPVVENCGMWPFSEPSLETATRISDIANWGLIGSLMAGVLSTFVIVKMGNVKLNFPLFTLSRA
jgi:SAM domain (Sterile alpha motif)